MPNRLSNCSCCCVVIVALSSSTTRVSVGGFTSSTSTAYSDSGRGFALGRGVSLFIGVSPAPGIGAANGFSTPAPSVPFSSDANVCCSRAVIPASSLSSSSSNSFVFRISSIFSIITGLTAHSAGVSSFPAGRAGCRGRGVGVGGASCGGKASSSTSMPRASISFLYISIAS